MIRPGDGDRRHGTVNGYVNHGCRCRPCTIANTAYHAPRITAWRRRKGVMPRDERIESRRPDHGTCSKYGSGCRCDLCRAASTAYKREQRARKRSQTQSPIDVRPSGHNGTPEQGVASMSPQIHWESPTSSSCDSTGRAGAILATPNKGAA